MTWPTLLSRLHQEVIVLIVDSNYLSFHLSINSQNGLTICLENLSHIVYLKITFITIHVYVSSWLSLVFSQDTRELVNPFCVTGEQKQGGRICSPSLCLAAYPLTLCHLFLLDASIYNVHSCYLPKRSKEKEPFLYNLTSTCADFFESLNISLWLGI